MKQMNKNNNQQPFIVALECTKGSTVDWGRLRTPGAGVSQRRREKTMTVYHVPAAAATPPRALPPLPLRLPSLDRPAFESRRRRQMAPSSPS